MADTRFQKTPLHYLQYLALKFFCVILGVLPYKAAVGTSRFLTGISRYFLPKRFQLACHNIALAFPEKSAQEVKQIAVESWKNMGGIMAEVVQLTHMKKDEFLKHCRIIGIEKMYALKGKSGALIHIGHFTNWEAFGLCGSLLGVDKAVLAQRVDNPYIDEEINRLRNTFSGQVFYSNNEYKPFFACMRWLKKKKVLGILFDQNVVSGEMWLPFMGRICAWSPITALLAIKMQIPVYPVKVWREKDGTIVSEILDPVYPPTEYSMDNVRHFTKQLVGFYEQWLKENPSSWLWAHNRWKREQEGENYLAQHPEERV